MQTSKYEVLGLVGEGAYGVVYKCRNKETNEFVAIKKFKETEDDIVKKSMLRELKVLKILKHENIVEFKEAFKRKGNLYLVFEYVEKTLLELVQQKPKGLDPELIRNIIFQLCKAIKHLHDLNIIHRDIKPENLLIDPNNKLKLCDFGFARSISMSKEQLTDYVATRWYRSPELLLGNGYYGPEMDYWAIGCIMGELADGEPLFPGEDEVDQIICIIKIFGKLTDDQIASFNKTQRFNGIKLPDISKPETLEKRYSGKLNKTAINFMKLLLHPDPTQRLKGELIFQHPYLEPLTSQNGIVSQRNSQSSALESVNKTETLELKLKKVSTIKVVNETIPKEQLNKQPIIRNAPLISNTTNINIINYNYDKNKIKEEINNTDFEKSLKKNTNMIQTTSNFPKGYKENLINMYGGTHFNTNFKTFYKNDKYNYEIDLNFKNSKKQPKLNSIYEEEENSNKKLKFLPKHLKQTILKVKNFDLGAENELKIIKQFKINKNTDKLFVKNSPNKYTPFNNTKMLGTVNANGFNLPNISLKNFKIKK